MFDFGGGFLWGLGVLGFVVVVVSIFSLKLKNGGKDNKMIL